jgi:opacity protein-like surface antigen
MGMFQRKIMLVAVLILGCLLCAYAADITGKWTAEFDSQIGQQKYTFDFKVDGDKLTGTLRGGVSGQESESEIQEGKMNGNEISFVEMLNYQGQDLKVIYTGTISGDEIKFNRNVADMVNETLVAKRAK